MFMMAILAFSSGSFVFSLWELEEMGNADARSVSYLDEGEGRVGVLHVNGSPLNDSMSGSVKAKDNCKCFW